MINKVGVNMQKIKGLTNQEVLDQIDLGHMNISPKPLVKTNKQIIFEHVFNLFNATLWNPSSFGNEYPQMKNSLWVLISKRQNRNPVS